MQDVGDDVLHGHGSGGSRLAIEDREFAKALAWVIDLEGDFLAKLADEEDAHASRFDDVQDGVGAALVEDDGPFGKGPPMEALGQGLQFRLRETSEQGHVAQQVEFGYALTPAPSPACGRGGDSGTRRAAGRAVHHYLGLRTEAGTERLATSRYNQVRSGQDSISGAYAMAPVGLGPR